MSEFSRNLAFIIGINNYTNGISSLQNATNDAKNLVEVLREKHSYQVWVCLDEVATLKSLKNFLEKTLPQQVTADDRLLFYFAGHGIALNGDDGPEGYLIPQDAKLGDTKTYLPMTYLQEYLSNLPCRHFLGILDCCFAGAFRWSSTRDLLAAPEVIHKERYDRFIADPAWQIITSAAYDQKALDAFNLNTERGQIGDHSPFAAALLEALTGSADAYQPASNGKPSGDGIITATELYLYLRDAVEPATQENRQRQTPGIWPLKKHDKGEYIFLVPGHPLNLPPAPPLDESQNPYRGLESFNEEHTQLFFGRQALTKQLFTDICQQPLTVVLGASGTGKSSLVKAGLIAYIKNLDTTHQPWRILEPMRPGESPLRALNNTLTSKNYLLSSITSLPTFDKVETLGAHLATWMELNPQSKLLLVIDQFEELITLCKEKQERELFLNFLAEAVKNYSQQLRLVLTLRWDFESQFRDTALKQYWIAARFIVPPMTRTELRQAIEEPASTKVMYFKSNDRNYPLVDRLIDEVANMPGALPLLSFTLSELYLKYLKRQRIAQQRGETIDRAIAEADYQELGGVTLSLTQRADREYEELVKLAPAYEQTIRHVMLRMVAVGTGELTARRRVSWSELEYPEPENQRVKQAIERFSAARLLIEGQDTEGKSYVEPAHDALVQSWQKLLVWKQDPKEQEISILQQQLTAVAVDWKNQQPEKFHWNTAWRTWFQQLGKRNQQLGLLWNANPRLDLLKQVLNSQTDNWLNQVETEFVVSSLQRRRNNQLRAYGLGTLVLTGALLFAFNQWNQNQQTQSLNLATFAKQKFGRDQQLDALVDGLKAGKTLQRVVWIPPETTIQVVTALQQVVDKMKEHNRLQGHSTTVGGVSFCNDGKTIASISRDGIVKRWGLDGKELDTIDGQSADVSSVSFSSDCKMVAFGSRNANITLLNLESKKSKKFIFVKGTVTVWSLGSKKTKELVPLKGRITSVTSVSFSPDSKLLASGSEDGTVTLWSINGDQLWTIQGHSTELDSENNNIGTVRSVGFSPDGKTIASSGDTTKLWSLDGKLKAAFKEWGYVSFSPEGEMLVLANSQRITLWDLNGQALGRRAINGSRSSSVSFSPDGKTIASADSFDGSIKLWNLDGNELTTINGHSGSVNSLSFSLDGKTLAAGNEDGSIKLWSLSNESLTLKLGSLINCFSFSPDGKTIALGGFKKVTTWSLDGKLLKTFEVAPNAPDTESSNQVESLSFSPDGKSLAASANFIIQLWSLENGKELWKRPESGKNYSSSFSSVSFSPDGKIATPLLGEIEILSSDGKKLNTLKGYSGKNNISFSPDGKTLAVPKNDNTIQRWRITDGKELPSLGNPARSIQGGKTQATSISFSPDSKILASGSSDGTIELWNLENGKNIGRLNGHTDDINSVSFSQDGKILASASADNSIRFWSLKNVTEVDKIALLPRSKAYFSPDGKTLAVVSGDTVALLNIDLNDLLRRGCDRVRNYLKNNPNVSQGDRYLCDNVPKVVAKDKSF
jgi:WD40 repeat protein